MSRREAVLRLGLLGLSATATIASIAGCETKPPLDRPAIDPWWDRVVAHTADIPVISSNIASQLLGGTTISATSNYESDTYFRYDGCHRVFSDTAGIYAKSPEVVAPEIVTDAREIETIFRAGRTGTQVVGLRVVVDGKLSNVKLRRFDAVDNVIYYYKHRFSDTRVRHLKFEIDGANRFVGAVVGAHSVLQRPRGAHKFRHTAIGDSLQKGGPNYHLGDEQPGDLHYMCWESHSRFHAALMGCDSYINLGVGGTGWSDVTPNNPYAARIPLALQGSPHVLGFYGSRNDTGKEVQVGNAVSAALFQVRHVPVVLVSGPQQAGYADLNRVVGQAVKAAGRNWLDLDGAAASPDSNQTHHPTLIEQLDLARIAHSQTDTAQIRGTVEMVNNSRLAAMSTALGALDSFDRPDGKVGLSDDGKPWNDVSYTGWAIRNGTLVNATANSQAFCDIDAGIAFGTYEFTLAGTYHADLRLCFFYVNGSAHVFINTNSPTSHWRLYVRVGNSSRVVTTGTAGAGWAAGDVIRMEVTPGTTFTTANFHVQKNGTTVLAAGEVELGPLLADGTRLAIGVNAASCVASLDALRMTPRR